MRIKRFFRKLHLILGLIFGIIIIVTCLSGAVFGIIHLLPNEVTSKISGFTTFVISLHRHILLPDKGLGKLIVGMSTLVFLTLIITGIIIIFPKKLKYLRLILKLRFSRGVIWHSLHVVLGLYSSLWLILICLTGLCWTFPSVTEKIATFVNVQSVPQCMRYKTVSDKDGTKKVIDLQKSDNAKLKFMTYVKVIHFGRWGGSITEILNIIFVLIGASLPISGLMLFVRRKRLLK